MTDTGRRARLSDIITLAARVFDLSETAIRGPSRKQNLFTARMAIAYVARKQRPLFTWHEIARGLGGRDHTSIINAWHRANDTIARDDAFAADVTRIRELAIITPPYIADRALTERGGAPQIEREIVEALFESEETRVTRALAAIESERATAQRNYQASARNVRPRNRIVTDDNIDTITAMASASARFAAALREAQ